MMNVGFRRHWWGLVGSVGAALWWGDMLRAEQEVSAAVPGVPSAMSEAVVEPETPPPGVVPSALAAVEQLGLQAVQGKFETALERMYPPWRHQSAVRAGGEAKFIAAMNRLPAEMAKAGVTLLSCKPSGSPTVLEAVPGMRRVQRQGQVFTAMRHTKWLVLVPTVTVFQVIHQVQGQPPRRVKIESTGYQIAIADKAKLDWTFIDGSSVTIADLRALFSTLPADLKLPPLSKREVR